MLKNFGNEHHNGECDQKDFKKNKSKEELLAEERDYKRRRMSYRGKKAQRTPAEVLRDIIEGHMEDIVAAGGIGCIGRRPHDVLLSESETLSSALGENNNTLTWQSRSRDVASKELHSAYYDRSRFSSSSQRHDQSSQERSESLSYAHSGDKSSDRKYESTRDRRKWESTHHGERQSRLKTRDFPSGSKVHGLALCILEFVRQRRNGKSKHYLGTKFLERVFDLIG
ncbi:hypothetical protein L7F22_059435 [Adiantum nelumboides]|nr:hypothetical protein [Adiantum nelumboides]